MTRLRSAGLIAAAALLWPAAAPAADTATVLVALPLPPRIDTSIYHRVLCARVVTNDLPLVDPGRETVAALKRLMARGTSLAVLDVEPPNLPEQTEEELLKNAAFWKHIAEEYGADLVVSGSVSFTTKDVSGFVEEDIISPVTGQKIRQTRYAEREAFTLRASLWFFKGANGSLLYEDSFRQTQTYEGKTTEALAAFYEIIELMNPEFLSVLATTTRQDPRTIYTR